MSNVETNLIKPFPVAFSGHTLKYEIECICKIFLPMRKFTFLYDTTQLPAGAEEGAVLILEQLGEQFMQLEPLWGTGTVSGAGDGAGTTVSSLFSGNGKTALRIPVQCHAVPAVGRDH